MLELAKQEVHSAQYAKIKIAAVSVKNEVLEMVERVQEKMGRLLLRSITELTVPILRIMILHHS